MNNYNLKCKVCGKIITQASKFSDVCPDCEFVYQRAKEVQYRLSEPVDFEHIRSLLFTENCTYCGKYIPINERIIEHKTPVCRNGHNNNDNLCMSCTTCNSRKGSMTYDEYKHYLSLQDNKKNDTSQLEIRLQELKNKKLIDCITEKKIIFDTIKHNNEKVLRTVKHLNNDGSLIGIYEEYISQEPVKITKIIKTEFLTPEGRMYNDICVALKRKPIKPKRLVKTKSIEKLEIINYGLF